MTDRHSLDAVQLRALGVLIEKQITTPEYYPLTLNALVNACNQTTNRDPVTSYHETDVARALERLRGLGLAWEVTNSRAHKFGTPFSEKLELGAPETAVMCVLMLRGPQTAGEIRARTGRLHQFHRLEEVDAVFAALVGAEPPLAAKLPRLPGTKEARFAHLLGAGSGVAQPEPPLATAASTLDAREEAPRLEVLEREVEVLRQELLELRRRILDLQRRLE